MYHERLRGSIRLQNVCIEEAGGIEKLSCGNCQSSLFVSDLAGVGDMHAGFV